MADNSQQGPLSAEQLLAIWRAGADGVYTEPFVAAGDGNGLEVHTQSFAQWARVSLAVDRTFQSMYALPWSGQTNPPASGAAQSTCEIVFERTGRLEDTLVLGAGLIWVDEQATDASPTGPILVSTGRRYLLQNTVVFFPGEQGPWTGIVQAEKPGLNYDDPTPDSIDLLEQPGVARTNDLATVSIVLAPVPPAQQVPAQTVSLVGDDQPDMFTPDQVGQYVIFYSGANEGLSGRAVGFIPATATAGTGVVIEQIVSVLLGATPGIAFDPTQQGQVEVLDGATVVGSGILYAARTGPGGYCLAFALTSGASAPAVGYTVQQTVVAGTATGTISVVYQGGQFAAEAPSGAPETGGAGWRMAAWGADWGLSATNPLSPSGGALAMLDALGQEKNLPRLPGEQDPAYAQRITRIADVVTPNAIKRALVRDVGPTGWCFREVGSELLPGFYFDRVDEGGDAFDTACLLFNGTQVGGTSFVPDEQCLYMRGGDVVAEGYWGNYQSPSTVSNPSGYSPATYQASTANYSHASMFSGVFVLILSRDRFDLPLPTISVASGDSIVGAQSGAVFQPTSQIAFSDVMRWHVLLDYSSFRAFFLAGLPAMGLGEFGFAYDMPAVVFGPDSMGFGGYDASGTSWLNFYDGYPAGNGAYYLKIYNDLSRVVAGGVGFDFYTTNGTACS